MRVTLRKVSDTAVRLSMPNASKVFEFKNDFQLREFVTKTQTHLTEKHPDTIQIKVVGF
jgi:hypothetical protein